MASQLRRVAARRVHCEGAWGPAAWHAKKKEEGKDKRRENDVHNSSCKEEQSRNLGRVTNYRTSNCRIGASGRSRDGDKSRKFTSNGRKGRARSKKGGNEERLNKE